MEGATMDDSTNATTGNVESVSERPLRLAGFVYLLDFAHVVLADLWAVC